MVRAAFETMFRWFEEGKLHPTTSHRFPVSEYASAMDAALARQAIGKIVLEMPRAALIDLRDTDQVRQVV
jgi:NADPH:quinone reductase